MKDLGLAPCFFCFDMLLNIYYVFNVGEHCIDISGTYLGKLYMACCVYIRKSHLGGLVGGNYKNNQEEKKRGGLLYLLIDTKLKGKVRG